MRIFLSLTIMALLVGCDMIRDQLKGNQAPVIDTFEADPAQGEAPVLVGFSWRTVDLEGDALTCTLDFDDSHAEELQNCAQVTHYFHEYTQPGGYVALLSITDGSGSVSKSLGVRVVKADKNVGERP